MKIKSLQLKNFKRFTDLTIQDIPGHAKLVLLIGSNGSGKSSIFDALEVLSGKASIGNTTTIASGGRMRNLLYQNGDAYHTKNAQPSELSLNFINGEVITCRTYPALNDGWEYVGPARKNLFYGRSAFRYLPRITKTSIGEAVDINGDQDRPFFYIDSDNRFSNDIDLLIREIIEKVFKGINTNSAGQLDEIKSFLEKINAAFPRIFGTGNGTKLVFKRFVPPAEGKAARLVFQKGNSEIDYDLLSSGEKEVVNLLFNLFVRNGFYNDTIYFMDELDAHLNTKLQYNFIREIVTNWIPDNCQLWTASHSLGFIEYAKNSENAVILDFDDYDFDYSRILVPEPKDNPDIYQIAVDKDFLPSLFKNLDIVFVENKDEKYYGSTGIKNTVFVPENGRNGVYHKVKTGEYNGVVDRDFLTDEDVSLIEKHYKTLKVLKYYSIENYLYHPLNLQEYYSRHKIAFDSSDYIRKLISEKNKVKDSIIPGLSLKRTEYPYFGEPDYNGKSNQNRFKNKQENFDQSTTLSSYLNSDDFKIFYKVFPMKGYATHLPERQNINKAELAKTSWFKQQIESILKR